MNCLPHTSCTMKNIQPSRKFIENRRVKIMPREKQKTHGDMNRYTWNNHGYCDQQKWARASLEIGGSLNTELGIPKDCKCPFGWDLGNICSCTESRGKSGQHKQHLVDGAYLKFHAQD